MPNKFYESVITETPIIANRDTEFGHEVHKNKLGYGITEKNLTKELGEAIDNLVKDKNEKKNIVENMRNFKENCFWESNEYKLKNIYDK